MQGQSLTVRPALLAISVEKSRLTKAPSVVLAFTALAVLAMVHILAPQERMATHRLERKTSTNVCHVLQATSAPKALVVQPLPLLATILLCLECQAKSPCTCVHHLSTAPTKE